MKAITADWDFFSKDEFNQLSHTDGQIPIVFRQKETFQKLHELIYEQLADLKCGKGKSFKLKHQSIFIVKKEDQVWIGICRQDERAAQTDVKNVSPSQETSIAFQSDKMQQVMNIVRKVALVDSSVLLLGETGVGKSLMARQVHQYSNRDNNPFAEINCSTIPESLMEAELFGYTAGSFTGGSKSGKKGIFEMTMGGTVFLDEIGEIPVHLQAKLLEVLQENHIRPIGSTQSVPVNVRIIAATNRNLEEMVQKKTFREDLYYRLNVVPIHIPSIQERKEELDFLVKHFLASFNAYYHTEKVLSPDVMQVLQQYNWPGNVRELRHMIERLVVTIEDQLILPEHLPETFINQATTSNVQEQAFPPLIQAKKELEQELILRAYREYKTTYRVAEILQVNQSTIAKKVKQYRDEGVL